MNSNPKRLLTTLVTGLAAGAVLLSGLSKLTRFPPAMQTLQQMDVAQYVLLLGIMEIGFTALFLFSRTLKIGFILLSCYFAGALATELSHDAPLVALVPLILIWLSAFGRDRSIFMPTLKEA